MGNNDRRKKLKKLNRYDLKTHINSFFCRFTHNRNKKKKEIFSNLEDKELDQAKIKMEYILREEDYCARHFWIFV